MPYDEPPELPQPPELPDRAPAPDPESLEFPVVPQPESLAATIRRALVTMVVSTVLCAALFSQMVQEPEEMVWIYGFAAVFGLILTVVFVAFTRQTPQPSVLRIEPEHVRLRNTTSGAEAALPYGELWVAHLEGRGDDEKLVFKDRAVRLIAISASFLPDPRAAGAALAAVHERIGALPDGRQRMAGIAARQAVAERIRSARTIVVPAVAVLLGLVFLAEFVTGALDDPLRLWTFGANSSLLVLNGEAFRLVTANLLHGNLLHVFLNVMALVSLGALLEPLLGRGRFLTVLLVSALTGAAGSAFLGRHALSLGASTAVAGLIAAYVILLWRWPDRLAHPPTKATWFGIALAFVWPSLIFGQIDQAAHLAGFFGGAAVMSLDTRLELWELADRRRIGFRIAAALLVALFAAAGWAAVRHARDPRHSLRDAGLLARDFTLSPAMRNHLAWHIVTSPDASREQLWHALRGVESAARKEPETVELRDTQATAHYRLGQWVEAVQMEHELFAVDRKPFYAAQLARFEWALLQARGPLFLGERPPKAFPRAEIAPGPAVLLETNLDTGDPPLPPGTKVHLVLARGGKPTALLEVTMGSTEPSGPLRIPLPGDPAPDQVALALVDTRQPGGAGETRWELLPVVPEAARLP